MKNFLSKHAFWVLQIIGCAAFTVAVYLLGAVRGNPVSQVVFLIVMFLSWFIPTTGLRFLYKAFVKTNPFGLLDVLKILLFIGLVVSLMDKLPYYLGFAFGWIEKSVGINGKLETDFKTTNSESAMKYVGFSIIIITWTVFYFAIKQWRAEYANRLSRLKLKDRIKQAQLNTLKGHINPQFMVDSLASIKQMMPLDVTNARKKLTQLSELLRYSLTKNNINTVLVEEEYETAENYVALLDMADKENCIIRFDLAPETLKYGIPPMLLTSLVEMATKHGLFKQKEGGTVLVSSTLENGGLKISLSLDAKIDRTSEAEFLEKAIIQRLKLLFKQDAIYEVCHELNRTEITVLLPQDRVINHPITVSAL